MPGRKANQPQFLFFCGDLDTTTFRVISFTGKDSISSPYNFSISIRSDRADITAEEVINKQATLFMYRDEEYYLYSGIVIEFLYQETTLDYSVYHITLVPKLCLLDYNFQSKIFQKMSVSDIVAEVLDEAGLSDYYEFDLKGTYPERENVIQYQESDLNFISRLLEESGIWYFFKELPILAEEAHAVSVEKLIISDQPASFQNINGDAELIFRSGSGMYEQIEDEEKDYVEKISSKKRLINQSVLVKNYNYRTPEVDLSSPKNVPDGLVGRVYNYGPEIKDTDGAEQIADIFAKRIATNQSQVNGNSNCRGFRAGLRFNLQDHIRDECNDMFLLYSVVHRGTHRNISGSSELSSYKNDFVAIPSSMIELFKPPLKTPVPRVNGILTAAIEASGSEYASLDDMGRYKIRMPFDLSDSANYEGSKYIRLAQPYSGSNYGMHFPSHEGTEMILACVDGNPDRAVGIGTIPNANTISPVVSNNKVESVIRTAGGNEIILDDTTDKQKVTINSNAKNKMLFDDENKKIAINTTGDKAGNNQVLLDDQNKNLAISGLNHLMKMSYGDEADEITIQTAGEHIIKIDDKNKILTIQTAEGHVLQMDDNAKTITMTDCAGKNTVTLDGQGNGLSLDSQGEIKVTAKGDLTVEAANIKMTAKQAIEAKANMDIKMKGMNIESKSDMNMKIEGGMNTEVKGKMNITLEGGLAAKLDGKANTAITGGVVMIN